ncbi:MAG: epoxyqueuosine reductase QueH [Treponema sp.]|nr:epoxyqueuosine reductase QueH [Treponema sp.]
MAKSVYQKKLDELLAEIEKTGKRPSLLLHACCGPCSSYVLEYLTRYFDITILYYNPNIYPKQEYERRLAELENFLPRFSPAVLAKVKLVKDEYIPEDFYDAVGTDKEPALATEPEKGERCRRCYELRLKRSYDYAVLGGFEYFCTTLSISPFKDAEKINVIGEQLCARDDENSAALPKWLPSDFKKKSGFLRSLQLSEEYGLYRQQYCGCVFSMKNSQNS